MSIIKKTFKFFSIICLLFGLPVIGIILSGRPVKEHIQFPPETSFTQHESFLWAAFIILSVIILLLFLFIAIIIIKYIRLSGIKSGQYKIPRWGKAGIFCMFFFWVIAWGRFDIFAWFQPHTFFPLWLSYILAVNSIVYRRTGRCLLTGQTKKILFLFPLSILFWWYFEFLNTFVRNWSYTLTGYSGFEYLILSSIAFSTVLPAVASTSDLILCFIAARKDPGILMMTTGGKKNLIASIALILSSAGLLCIGIFPDYLFPLVWVSPLLIIISVQTLFNKRTILTGITEGNYNWCFLISASLSALFCGFFWEMWNYFSAVKWQYSIPFVNAFRIFEMPVLGYAGYIPFGLLCIVIAEMTGTAIPSNPNLYPPR